MSIEWQKNLHGISIKSLIKILKLEDPEDFIFAEGHTLLILDKDKKHQGSIYLKEKNKEVFMKVAVKFLIVLMILALTSCAYVTQLKQDWKALKSDEKARIVCEFLQSELEITFDTAKTYVATKPEYQADWKAKVVPSFSVANKALAGYMIQAKEGKVTFIDVVRGMQSLLQPILTTLGSWGVDVTNISKFTSLMGG